MKKLHYHCYDFSPPWIREKTPLLLIHGHGADSGSWFTQVPDFARHFPVIVVDLPGCGGSAESGQRLTIEAIAKAVRDSVRDRYGDRLNVMGISLGGFVSVELAARYADEIGKLVLIGTPHSFSEELKITLRATLEGYRHLSMKDIVEPKIGRAFGRLASDEMKRFLADDILKTSKAAYLNLGQAPIEYDPLPRYPLIQARTLIIAGELDYIAGPDQARKIQAELPGSELLILADTGHAANLENPAVMNPRAIEFLLA